MHARIAPLHSRATKKIGDGMFGLWVWLLLQVWQGCGWIVIAWLARRKARWVRFGRRVNTQNSDAANAKYTRFQPKPPWVVDELIRLRAHLPRLSFAKLTHVFNRVHARRERVSTSYVHKLVTRHRYAIEATRKAFRKQKPIDVPRNGIWAIDLTGKQDAHGEVHSILGIFDHGSRLALALEPIRRQGVLTLLGHLFIAMDRVGVPLAIRTDNAGQFTSRLFRAVLKVMRVRHQRTAAGCPWMNGRIERLFGTLKNVLDQVVVRDARQLSVAIAIFREWYNEVRTHNNLGGRTPAEAWTDVNPYACAPKAALLYREWDGLLEGVRLRR